MKQIRSIRSVYVLDAFICVLVLIVSLQVARKVGNEDIRNAIIDNHSSDPVLVDQHPITSVEQLDFYLDGRTSGEIVECSVPGTAQSRVVTRLVLQSRYNLSYFIVTLLVSAVFVFLALFVIRRRFGERSAHIFHHLCIAVALLLCSNPLLHSGFSSFFSRLSLLGYFVSYGLVPVLLLHFTLLFPSHKPQRFRPVLSLFYAIAIFLGAVLYFSSLYAFSDPIRNYDQYSVLLSLCRGLFILYVVASVARLVRSYMRAQSTEDRRKLLWVLLGFAVSVLSFALLWLLPLILHGSGLISEELVSGLTIVAPITFSIAILRYHAFDIDLIINRGTVYVLVVGLLVTIYSLLMSLAVSIVGRDPLTLEIVIPCIVLLTVLLFAPTRGLIQSFVDRTFFRVQYDFRNTQRALLQRLSNAVTIQHVAETVVSEIDALMHPERIAFVQRMDGDVLAVVASRGLTHTVLRSEELYDPSYFVATYSMLNDEGTPVGYICCGPKKSSQRYNDEDIDLLVTLSSQCASTLNRAVLQEQLLLEHMESQRLLELNQLKSYFVSGVTHELKTPLTSIRMFAEMLQTHVNSDKALKYLGIIEGESDRLTRLINNVLNFAMVEKGVLQYHPSTVDLHEVVGRVLEMMQYQIQINGFKLDVDMQAVDTLLFTDPDALSEVLINLISNALKYSADNKYVRVATRSDAQNVQLIVEDHGIGIPEKEATHIFEPFIRLKDSLQNRARGAGLGLALVKHYVDANSGTIDIQSTVGQGTTITISLKREVGQQL